MTNTEAPTPAARTVDDVMAEKKKNKNKINKKIEISITKYSKICDKTLFFI